MFPIFIYGVAALGLWALKKHHSPVGLTPERAAVHGYLMAGEFRPAKLRKMAAAFAAEGLDNEAKELSAKADEVQKQAKAAAMLVEAARAGDQNMMGLIAATRENAQAGDKRAQVTCALMLKYCECRPMPALGPLGEMPIDGAAAPAIAGDPHAAFMQAQQLGLIGSPFGCT